MNHMDELILKLKDNVKQANSSQQNSFAYIIGNNGSGKSRALRDIAKKIAADHGDAKILCVANTVYDRFQGLKDKRIIYLGMRNVNNAIFYASIGRQLATYLTAPTLVKEQLEKIEKNMQLKFKLSITEQGKKYTEVLDRRREKTSIDKIISAEDGKNVEALFGSEHFISDLKPEQSKFLNTFLSLRPKNIKVLLEMQHGQYDFGELSSGEQTKILTSLKIALNAEDNCVILIDEPEISYHLHWQMTFHNDLEELLSRNKGIYCIIATHSPVVVSEAMRQKKTDAVIIMDKGNETSPIIYKDSHEIAKESYDRVILDYFYTSPYRSTFVEEEIARTVTSLTPDSSSAQVNEAVASLKKIKEKVQGLGGKEGLIKQAIDIIENMKEWNDSIANRVVSDRESRGDDYVE
ncbi:AAA family ATPase [Kosakonia sp. YIM B13605]|uniref:AAA family ATPase n=1 Tax=Kosakonia TaxID=1330547 RepID=UPI0028AB12E9|nr:AAA family ATPase [Kosakonia sacchari]